MHDVPTGESATPSELNQCGRISLVWGGTNCTIGIREFRRVSLPKREQGHYKNDGSSSPKNIQDIRTFQVS